MCVTVKNVGFNFLPKLLQSSRWLETYKNKAAVNTEGHMGIVSSVTSQQADFPEALALITSWKVVQT